MYAPKKHLTEAVLAEVLAEFEWPAAYTLEDWLPDGIGVLFPKCILVFKESFESDMVLKFDAETTGLDNAVDLKEALLAIGDERGAPYTPGLSKGYLPGATLEKVQVKSRDLCKFVLTHFRASLLGDFGWVEQLKEYRVRTRAANAK